MKVRLAVSTALIVLGSVLVPAGQAQADVTASFTGDATFYYPGLGACGRVNKNSDLVAALPKSMFDPSPGGNPTRNKNCGRLAIVTRNAKSVIVRIVDRCEGCKFGDIDLSPAAFNKIAKPEEGRVKVSWTFVL